jgi:hypothetical protein
MAAHLAGKPRPSGRSRIRRPPSEHHQSTPPEHPTRAPPEHHQSTTRAPSEHHQSTIRAPSEHHQSTPPEHHQSTPSEHHQSLTSASSACIILPHTVPLSRTASHRIASHRIASRRIASHRIASRYIQLSLRRHWWFQVIGVFAYLYLEVEAMRHLSKHRGSPATAVSRTSP